MHNWNCLLYSFLLIFVIGYTVDSSTTTPTPPPFITYTCSGGKVTDVDMSILDKDATHISVLKKDGGYCQPKQRSRDGIITCIKAFNNGSQSKDKIKEVTILYEDETTDGIVGGIHSKYYTLSCVEKVGVVTVVMSPMTVGTTIPSSPTVLHADLKQTPILTIAGPQSQKYVGDRMTLQMTVNSEYILLPQSCSAHHADPNEQSHTFWDNCQLTDKAIIPSVSWTKSPAPAPTQSSIQIDMYAFRFVDTEELIIKCQTTVCPSNDQKSCDMKCNNRRKRRIANNQQPKTNSTRATVSIALKVFDRQFQENSSQALSPIWYIYTIGFGLIYWITLNKL